MVQTGGRLKPKLVELIGELNQAETLNNINKDIREIERKLKNQDSKIQLNVELFGNVKEMAKDITEIQAKIKNSPSLKDIELGVKLGDVTLGDLKTQIKELQDKFTGREDTKLKLDVDFDFKGSASKIKEEMEGIRQFMERYGDQMKNMDLINLDKDAQNVKKNAEGMKTGIQSLGQGVDTVSNGIEADMRKMTTSSGRFGVSFERDVNGAIKGATGTLTNANGTIEKFKYNIDSTTGELVHMSRSTQVAGDQQERYSKLMSEADKAQKDFNKALADAPHDANTRSIAESTQSQQALIEKMRETGTVTDEGSSAIDRMKNATRDLKTHTDNFNLDQKFKEASDATRQAVVEFERLGGSANDVKRFEDAIDNMANGATGDMNRLQSEVKEATESMLRDANRFDSALSNMERQQFQTAIKDRDIETVRRYVEQIEGAEVSSVRFTQRKDNMGRSIDKVAVNMKEVNGAVDSYTYEMNRADGTIDKVNSSTKELSDSNRGLEGGFGAIVGRIAQYMGAMQLVQKSMQALKTTIREIREIDKGRIELARVADASINLDIMLDRSVSSAKELGSNVHDILGSVGEMARTFGEYNEAQLIAVSRTATMMTNVSELNMGEATKALVSGIQAFNIEAEDSIRIVNAMNEADNNYAISSHQLGTSLQRAGATANTFGVELEELIGHTTAIGAVTQESGQRIGTALRTIYSRITTIDGSREVLEDLGIAMYEMGASGPEIRSVTDILGDLSDQWADLSDEQRQNIGVTMAGRARLTQFLALMNNYDMAIDSTTSALNSQGSAMREQEAYMQSYEAQFNILGTAVTELALSIEDELIGDALYLFASTAVDVLGVLDNLIDKFGVLPVIVGGATTAFLTFGGESSKALLGSVASAVETFVLKMSDANGIIGKIGTSALDAMDSMGIFGKFLTGGAVLGAVMLVAKGIEYLIGKMAETRRANEEAERSFANAMEVFNQNGQNIDGMIDRYEELNNKLEDNKEALEPEELHEYNTLVNDLSTMMPSAVSHIDAQGQAHLKTAESIRDSADALRQMSEANSAYVATLQEIDVIEHFEDMDSVFKRFNDSSENMDKRIDRSKQSFEDFAKEMREANKGVHGSIHNLELSDEKLREIYDEGIRNYADASTKHLSLQYELHGAYQETLLLLGDQTVAYMGSNGQLENVSTTAQALIRDYARVNEQRIEGIHLIENEEDRLQMYNEALGANREFGELVAQSYDHMAEGLGGLDTDRAIEEFDRLVGSLPDEALKGSMGEIEGYFDGMARVVRDIMTNAEVDVDNMVNTLVNAGMDVDTATQFIIDLGIEMENQAIRVAVAEEELTSYNDELTHTRDLALETVDPLSALFGLDSESGRAMDSHIQTLQVLRQQYGDTWSEMDQGKESIGALAREFGVSESFIISNLDEMGQAIRALNTATVEWSDESQEYVWSFDETVTKSTRNLVMSMLENGDAYDGFVRSYVEQNGIIMHSQEELDGFTEKLTERFNAFAEAPNDRNSWNLLVGDLSEQLEHLYGTFMVVEDEVGNLKFQLADGTESEYFNSLNEQLEESDLKLEIATGTAGELLEIFVTGLDGESLHTLAVIDDMAQSGTFAIQNTEEALKGLISTATSDEDRKTFVETLSNQLDFLEEDVIATENEAGNLILTFEDPSITSPWLDALNGMIEDLGLKIDVTKDEVGDFILSIQTEEGETIFTQTAGEAQEAKDKIEEVDEKVDEVTKKEREPINMYLDKEDVDEKTNEIDTELNELINSPFSVLLDMDKTEFDEKTDEVDIELDELTYNPFSVLLDMDKTEFDETADIATEKTKELEEEKVTPLKIDIDEEGFNRTVDKVIEVQTELRNIDEELAELERILRVTNEQMGSLMTNTRNINDARNAIRRLKDDVDEAISKMGELYEKFSSGGIDTSGFENSAGRIREEVDGVESSLKDLRIAVSGLNGTMKALNEAFDISPMVTYRVGMTANASGIETRMNELSGSIRGSVDAINVSLTRGNVHLNNSVARTADSLTQMNILYKITREMVVRYIEEMGIAITDDYIDTVTHILATTQALHRALDTSFKSLSVMVTNNMKLMGRSMRDIFESTTNEITSTARSLPSKIGGGILANMSNATNSMGTLAKNMVTRFKRELGIRSPSRVFEQLGGDVIDGLVNGLSGSDITNLGQNVFSDFSAGAISTIDQIKGYMEFSPVSAGSFGNAFSMTSGFGPRRSPNGIGSTNHRGVDYGAPMGTPIPSQSSGRVVASGWMGGLGNAVIIESAGGIQHVYGHNSANHVRVGQMVGRGQPIGAVGSTGNSTGPHVHYEVRVNGVPIDPRKRFRGFATGGFVDSEELAFVGEEGLEAIIPLMPHRKDRGLDLWAETGEILGLNSSLIEMLIRSQKRSGSFSTGGGFTGLDGEAGSGETATATSGTIAPDYTSIMRSLDMPDQPMFSGMADENRMEDLYRRDMHAINVGRFSGMLTKANTELTALMENTLKYRNALEEVNYQERRLRDATQKQLNASIKRQSQIEKELGKLRNTSKHTEEQRKKYNELQQEFDRNSESIMSMENEIRKLNISMDQRKVEIYTDYIGQLTKGFEDLTSEIDKTISDLQFSLDYLTLTDENNIGAQLRIQYDVLRESIRLENTLMNNVNKLQSEYSRAVSRYGRDSEQALLARDELYSAESAYQGSVLNRINLEREVEKTREDVANEGIDTLKSYYKQTQTMTERAIELERKALEKHHENKMSMYDDEIAKIESVYDTRIAEMDAQEAEDAYNETISDLNTQRAELMQQISRASRDTSLEGRKRLAELQSQLGEVNSEIETTQKDRQDQMYREAIERQKQEQIQAVEMQKERAEMEQEIRLESLDQQLTDAQNYAERMINDEAMWERLRNEFIAGNGTGLASMTNEMTEQMSRFMSGDFRGVSMGYSELSDGDRELFSEEMLLEISNLMLESSESMERFVSTANESVQNIGYVTGGDYNAGAITTGRTGNISTQAKAGPTIPPAPKPAPKPVADNRHYTVKKGDTLWDLAQKYYGNPYQWTKIAQANENPDPRKLQIGRRLIIPFDTGGYTGDWMGDEGKVALLHKKELVLNESQTRDILDVAKIVDKISGFIPRISASKPNLGNGSVTNTGDNYNLETLVLEIPDFKGDEKDARRVFDNMAKSLKKLGK